MGQKSGFFTSNNGDRKYTSDWLAQYIAGIISNGVYTTELTVSGGNGNMSVTVGTGRAWINGYMYCNDAALKLPLSAADGALSRTDIVVLRLDMTNRQITLAVVPGTFGSGAPALTRTADIYELELAEIAVAAGTTAITPTMITDKRADETVCGIVAGAVKQLSTGELLEQVKAGFDEWFTNVKTQLSTDTAGNLQNQIDAISKNGRIIDSALDSMLVKLVSGDLQTLDGSSVTSTKIEAGTYMGTGAFGQGSENTLTFSVKPKLVVIMKADEGYNAHGMNIIVAWSLSTVPRIWLTGDSYTTVKAAYSGNTMTWYSQYNEQRQMNASGTTYAYVAFC